MVPKTSLLQDRQRTDPSDFELLTETVKSILASPSMQRSHRLSQLLTYLFERTLDRDFDSLKECAIGHRIFGRPPSYNAAEDNIVRSNIHQLRLKIGEYYATLGAADDNRLVLPKGSYALVLERRSADSPSCPEPPESVPVHMFAARPNRRFGSIARLSLVVAAALSLIALFAIHAGTSATSETPACLLTLLAPPPGQRLMIVVPDASLQLYQHLTGQTVTIQDYAERRFLQPAALRGISPKLADSPPDLFSASITQSFVLDLIPRFVLAVPNANLSVRNADAIGMKDCEKDNALLISGPFGDPWVQLYDRDLNFQIQTNDGKSSAYILNRKPHESERRNYFNYIDKADTSISYARIAYLPGLSPGAHVLLAGGPHIASTKAACEFLTRPEGLASLRNLFHSRDLPYFELLIESRALGNAPWQMKVIASRIVHVP